MAQATSADKARVAFPSISLPRFARATFETFTKVAYLLFNFGLISQTNHVGRLQQ